MNFPWDRYEFSDPFLVSVTYYEAKYFMWRRNLRTGQFSLKPVNRTVFVSSIGTYFKAPNPIEVLPPVLK